MAAVDRELTITYGGVSVGGFSENYQIHSLSSHSITDGTSESSFQFDVVVTADDESMFAALCRSLETAYRTPRKSLSVSIKGASLLNVSHSSASGGFNTDPDIEKPGSPEFDSGRSRLYRCRVKYETPADTASTDGLRERTINVEYDASRIRTVRIAGTFTATSGNTSSRARYEAAISALASSALSGLSVTTSELVGEPVTEEDYDDKVIRFERTYRELIFGQGQDSPTDDSGIVDQTLTVSRRDFAEERSEGAGSEGGGTGSASADVKTLAVFDLHYECSIDNTVTTDLVGKYDAIKDWLIGQFNAVFNQSDFALVSERVMPDRARNRLIVDLVAEGAVDGLDFVRRTFSVQDRVTEALVLRGVHTGNSLSRYRHRGFAEAFRVVTETYRRTGQVSQSFASRESRSLAKSISSAPVGDTFSGGGSWMIVDSQAGVTPTTIGTPSSGYTMEFSDVTTSVTMQYVKLHSDAASTGEVDRQGAAVTAARDTGVGANTESISNAGSAFTSGSVPRV